MIDRIARIVSVMLRGEPSDGSDIAVARAVLEAMMEPTEEMLEAGYHAIWFEDHDEDGRAAEHAETRCWKAMLKTALEERHEALDERAFTDGRSRGQCDGLLFVGAFHMTKPYEYCREIAGLSATVVYTIYRNEPVITYIELSGRYGPGWARRAVVAIDEMEASFDDDNFKRGLIQEARNDE